MISRTAGRDSHSGIGPADAKFVLILGTIVCVRILYDKKLGTPFDRFNVPKFAELF